ncbi:DUF1697 domain-containing protein [Pseudalkalibacillus berkeleyi]|uniref:DUF1697 domain-containing protein n=1 Tax=Pseudalkalibacillus berkeleyi TaxID=1069813 RepID=A0ABS9GUM2_9BACL|nr:DUF1697 domain-containing protein [Pseudalkalibacillus berkeleyi]MCF6136534.1 DUF1697 domain-containing protein [Pseudalkalibacillus berkeleyi]
MPTYIALLRGINVGGHKKVKMDRLKEIFSSIGFEQVRTYIQSGNVIFETRPLETSELIQQIESQLKEALEFEVPVIVKTAEEWKTAIGANPFDVDLLKEDEKLHVSFLAEKPSTEAVEKLLSVESDIDDFQIEGKTAYIVCRKGYKKTVFSNTFIEKKLKVAATTRNWNSVMKIAEMSK